MEEEEVTKERDKKATTRIYALAKSSSQNVPAATSSVAIVVQGGEKMMEKVEKGEGGKGKERRCWRRSKRWTRTRTRTRRSVTRKM